jgi:hypothetical protein
MVKKVRASGRIRISTRYRGQASCARATPLIHGVRVTNEAVNGFPSKSQMKAALTVSVVDGSVIQLKYSMPATILGSTG